VIAQLGGKSNRPLLAGDDLIIDQRLVARAQIATRGGNYYDAECLPYSAIRTNPANNISG
jgi:hypothetical protein